MARANWKITPAQTQVLIDELDRITDELKDAGISVIGCVASYKPDTSFRTRISLWGNRKGDEDHVFLDCIRELLKAWSEMAHKKGKRATRK